MHEVLYQLQEKGIILTINSNRENGSIISFVDKYFPDIKFSAIEGHNPDYPSKPHPYGINKILSKLNISKEDSLYIGDSKTDIKTTQNAKINCIIVKWGYGNQNDYENEYLLDVVEKPYEILNYF